MQPYASWRIYRWIVFFFLQPAFPAVNGHSEFSLWPFSVGNVEVKKRRRMALEKQWTKKINSSNQSPKLLVLGTQRK